MRALPTAALLDAWESGVGRSLCERALTLLSAACPDTPPDQLSCLPMGQRDSRLLALRELTFGRRLNAVVRCPRCMAQLEVAFDAADLRGATGAEDLEMSEPAVFTVALGDDEARFRLPNSLDLSAVAFERNISRARRLLLERCIVAITHGGSPSSIDVAVPQLLDMIEQCMAQVDPQGDVQVMFTCASCGHQHEVAFDIASFLWSEIDAWASRTFLDVHTLAKAYGWREAEILAMSPVRRQHYLDLVS